MKVGCPSRQRVGLASPDNSDTHDSNGGCSPASTRPQYWVQTSYAPRYHPSTSHKLSSQFQLRTDAMFKRRRGNGTQVIQNPLLAMITDTSFSLKDTSDIQRESQSRYTNELIQSCLRKTLNGQKSDPGLDTEGVHSMDTLKMDEPITLRTRRNFKSQYPSEPRKDMILLDKTDTEMRESLKHRYAAS
jgi:hypothetical protein